ncbi:MAG: ABC transporter ATP-binding protein [Moorellales bacterium]
METLLQVEDLRVQFRTEAGLVKAVDGMSYHINSEEIVGLVGESGCGKSVSQLAVLRLIRKPGEITGGRILFEGRDLLKLEPDGEEIRAIRGGKISMVFQEPMTSLNPSLTIGEQLMEMLELHLKMDRRRAKDRAAELLTLVGIPQARTRLDDYPHQFSGGMRQRVMIAMAISCQPRLIIADEPTTAVDVTTQAQLLELLQELVSRFRSSLIIVTHNLGVIARYAHRVYVMYAGRIVEAGTSEDIFAAPRHPYTIGLLRSVPRLDEERGRRLASIPGLPPSLINLPEACAFRPRCAYRTRCRDEGIPPWRQVGDGHYVRCYVDV